ncbi:MAG: MASE1 domain-containing protein [Leptolyngbyaceae cyanobacterium MO_188.B28]|nr:MASE1 domain-containing protein [Leptolyngbyaceae cyanobacterium MO_188.B28]
MQARLPQNWTMLSGIVMMAITYFFAAQLGLLAASLPGGVTVVCPTTGIALGVVLLAGYQVWPGIFLGALLSAMVDLLTETPSVSLPLTIAGGVAIASIGTLEPLLAALLINRYVKHGDLLNRVDNVGKFLALAGMSQLFPAVFGVTCLSLLGMSAWEDYGLACWTWWLSTAVGILIFTPLLLAWGKALDKKAGRLTEDNRRCLRPSVGAAVRLLQAPLQTSSAEVSLLIGLVAAISLLTFGVGYPLDYMLLVLLLWSAFRFGQRNVTLLIALISIIAIVGTVHGAGSFVRISPHSSLLLLQSFISVVAVTALVLCAALKERSIAQTRLAQTYIELERKVEERTAAIRESNEMLIVEMAERKQTEAELRESQRLIKQLNADLEQQVQERTAQLQRSLDFIALLNRITAKIRDSLEQEQILQTAVKALSSGLGASCCNAALYDREQGTSTVCYEYTTSEFSLKGRVSQMADYPELYDQLLQGRHFQFCSTAPNPVRGHVTMLACPILDDQGVLGDLWLVKQKHQTFDDQDVQLVQQVANQCAIALRQARLYLKAQTQVIELERLNRLKDDFLSTVSHELRSPMANIKMATQMLEVVLCQTGVLDAGPGKAPRYFQILRDECHREISLINDLLDLSRLEGGTETSILTTLDLKAWLPKIVGPFLERAGKQQQRLSVDIATGLPLLTVDQSHLERILTELIHNACKYTPAGETITLSAQLNGGGVQFRVTNSGVEIADDELPHIFNKFYRIPGNDPWKHGGTGLGLALVKKLVDHLGAAIWVESALEQTTFTLECPLDSSLSQSPPLSQANNL